MRSEPPRRGRTDRAPRRTSPGGGRCDHGVLAAGTRTIPTVSALSPTRSAPASSKLSRRRKRYRVAPGEYGIVGNGGAAERNRAMCNEAAVLRDAALSSGLRVRRYTSGGVLARIEVSPINMREPADIERAVAAFARVPIEA